MVNFLLFNRNELIIQFTRYFSFNVSVSSTLIIEITSKEILMKISFFDNMFTFK